MINFCCNKIPEETHTGYALVYEQRAYLSTNHVTSSSPRGALAPIGPMKSLPGVFPREQQTGAGGGVTARRRKSLVTAAAATRDKHVAVLKTQLRGPGLVFRRFIDPFTLVVGSNRRCYWEGQLVLSYDLNELTC